MVSRIKSSEISVGEGLPARVELYLKTEEGVAILVEMSPSDARSHARSLMTMAKSAELHSY